MKRSKFALTRFENRNGVASWRVDGRLNGARIRKNFKTREEAAAEQAALDIQALQIRSGKRAVATALTDEQLHEAEALFRRVAGHSRPLAFYVDFALTNYREPEKQKRLADAIADYNAQKQHELAQDQISIHQCNRIRRDLKRLQKHFPGVTVAELTVPKLVAFFERDNAGLKTYNNRRGIVSTFLKFAFHRGWIVENPIPKVPHHRIRKRRGGAHTLTAAQARTLMEEMENFEGGRWVPYFALCLFAGIRPCVPNGEITRLTPDAICLDTGLIHVSGEVSKVREPRKVTIQPNLAAWLRAYPLKQFPVTMGDFQRRRAALGKKFELTHDVMRHTFISMFVAKYRSIGEAAIQAGNSESIIRRHYLDLKSAGEAEEFFGIMPKRECAPAHLTPLPARAKSVGRGRAQPIKEAA